MKAGQSYRARIELSHFCAIQTRQEHQHASIFLKLRCPDEQGKWAWGAWSEAIPLPATVCSSLWQDAITQAPTLREITSDDGSRVAVLDLMLEASAKYVSVLEKPEGDEPYRQVSRPVFLDTGGRYKLSSNW